MKTTTGILGIAFLLLLTACSHVNPARTAKLSVPPPPPLQMKEFQPVYSKKLSAVKYTGGILVIRFRSGAVQRFDGVPEQVVRELMATAGKYGYYRTFIKHEYPMTILERTREYRESQGDVAIVRQHWLQANLTNP